MPRKIKYPTDKQLELWQLKRDKLKGKEIAERKKVTTGFVSKTLMDANERIRGLLEHAAHMNKITVEILSEEVGFARGTSAMLGGILCYITFSPKNGVQVWYEHKGDCTNCEKFAMCKDILLQEFKERNVKVDNPSMRPTDLTDLLFKTLEEMVET
ncbi:MAG: hypothetical protein JSV04_04655 [Candidatus Heimdallarchaeota archaeon]|nr:MAG: hypothetical protein JSV04_04655 [Candidatus Heimdallarchaeota archaeon]